MNGLQQRIDRSTEPEIKKKSFLTGFPFVFPFLFPFVHGSETQAGRSGWPPACYGA
jgi:hypothetical protein